MLYRRRFVSSEIANFMGAVFEYYASLDIRQCMQFHQVGYADDHIRSMDLYFDGMKNQPTPAHSGRILLPEPE